MSVKKYFQDILELSQMCQPLHHGILPPCGEKTFWRENINKITNFKVGWIPRLP